MNKIKRFGIQTVGVSLWLITGFGKANLYSKASRKLNEMYLNLL